VLTRHPQPGFFHAEAPLVKRQRDDFCNFLTLMVP